MALPPRTEEEVDVDPGGCEMTKMCNCWEGDPLPGTTTGTSFLRIGRGGGGGTLSDINEGNGLTDMAVSS